MPKTEIYSWRLAPNLKAALEEAARVEGESVAGLLDRIAWEWLEESREKRSDDEAQQRALRDRAMVAVGAFADEDPDRSTKVRELVRERLASTRAS